MKSTEKLSGKENLSCVVRIIVFTMKKLYSQFRISLLTFTLGLAAVWMMNGLEFAWSEVPVDLPTVRSEEVLFVFPIERKNMHVGGGGGSSCHDTDVQERLRAEAAKYGFVRGVRY